MDTRAAVASLSRPLATLTELGSNATRDIAAVLIALLADILALSLKTKRHFLSAPSAWLSIPPCFDEIGICDNCRVIVVWRKTMPL